MGKFSLPLPVEGLYISTPIEVGLGHVICFDQGNVSENDMILLSRNFKSFHHSFFSLCHEISTSWLLLQPMSTETAEANP